MMVHAMRADPYFCVSTCAPAEHGRATTTATMPANRNHMRPSPCDTHRFAGAQPADASAPDPAGQRNKELLQRQRLCDQVLLGHVLHQRRERRPVGLDAIWPWIAAE